MSETNLTLTADEFNKLVYHITKLYNHKQSRETETIEVVWQKAPLQQATP